MKNILFILFVILIIIGSCGDSIGSGINGGGSSAGAATYTQPITNDSKVCRTGDGTVGPCVNPAETVKADGTCSTSKAIDIALGSMHTLTLNGACAISFSNIVAGKLVSVKLTQSSTVAPTFTGATWAGGTAPTWSTSATKYDVFTCISFDGSTLQCQGFVDVR
jgi:hypothetical protein